MSLLEIIRNKLSSAGVVEGSTGWKCYIGYSPDDQDQIVGLALTGGLPQDTHGGENISGNFQVKVRAGKFEYAICEAKWRAVFNALQDADLSANNVNLIQAMSGEPLMFMDDKERQCATSNWRIVRAKP